MPIFTPHHHKITFREVWKTLHHVPSLDQKERNIILNYVKPLTDAGGITQQEIKNLFRQMRQNHILEIDDLNRAEEAILRLF